MTEVLLVNDRKNNNYGKEIFSVLSKKVSCIYISEKELLKSGKYPQILLVEKYDFERISDKNYIVVIGECERSIDISKYQNAHTVIIGSDNLKKITFSGEFENQVIFCGMSVRDTVTLSGVIGESVTLSVNRNVLTLGGKNISEKDIIFENNGYENFSIMAAGTVLLLI